MYIVTTFSMRFVASIIQDNQKQWKKNFKKKTKKTW